MNFCQQCGGYETTAVGVFAHNAGCPLIYRAASPLPVDAGEATHETHREVLRDGCTHCGASGNELREPCANAICPRCSEPFVICRCPPCVNCGAWPVEHVTDMGVCPRYKGKDAGDNVTQYEPPVPSAPPRADRVVYLEAALRALEAERDALADNFKRLVAERQEPIPCGVCGGAPLKSGRPCVCGGAGTEAAEMHGLRVGLFDADEQIEKLTAEVTALREDALTPEEAKEVMPREVDCQQFPAAKSAREKLLRIASRPATPKEESSNG